MNRAEIFPEEILPNSAALLQQGRDAAKNHAVGTNPFLQQHAVSCEAEFKRKCIADNRLMSHAQVGYRDLDKSCRAYGEIYEACAAKDVPLHRYGLCLDFSMGYPPDQRQDRPQGTGLILSGVEDFVRLTLNAPVAPHFGDFVLGMPAAFENTKAALASGSTAIGNLGQYFTFRLPHWDDDISITAATLKALGLIAGQNEEILVHSNLDDGFAALFCDLSCCLGAVLLEKYIVEELIGAQVSHCYGHHFSEPTRRMAFQLALTGVSTAPGTMIYGNTTRYRGTEQQNYADLESYLNVDIFGQKISPSGHAINPVPVSENVRIPDIKEIIAAQLFAGELLSREPCAETCVGLDMDLADQLADNLLFGAIGFQHNVLNGLVAAGINIRSPFEMMLALRRIGGKKLEELFGPGSQDDEAPRGRLPVVASTIIDEISELAEDFLKKINSEDKQKIQNSGLKVITATTDVHEHGKFLLDMALNELGVAVVDGGVSTDADDLASLAYREGADAIAISTYNGVALSFAQALKTELDKYAIAPPVIFGGRINQIPETSNTSLPVDVADDIRSTGAFVCKNLEGMVPILVALSREI